MVGPDYWPPRTVVFPQLDKPVASANFPHMALVERHLVLTRLNDHLILIAQAITFVASDGAKLTQPISSGVVELSVTFTALSRHIRLQ